MDSMDSMDSTDSVDSTDTIESLAGAEFAPQTTYLNTATLGLTPARAVAAVRQAVDEWAAGEPPFSRYEAAVVTARESFARLNGTTADRVAIGSAVSTHVAMVAAGLPAG